MIFQGIFILYQSGNLRGIVEGEGFRGSYESDIWDWMGEMDEGVRWDYESNWSKVWHQVCKVYLVMKKERQ